MIPLSSRIRSRCGTLGDLGWDPTPPRADHEALECFGGETSFRGWAKAQTEGADGDQPQGVTPYRRYFQLLSAGPGVA
jgi:hypothetical protein